jgi:transcriptional regulator of met regulon
LMSAYTKAKDFDRVIRFLSQNTNSNLHVKDLLHKLCHEPKLTDLDLQNYVLYIL